MLLSNKKNPRILTRKKWKKMGHMFHWESVLLFGYQTWTLLKRKRLKAF